MHHHQMLQRLAVVAATMFLAAQMLADCQWLMVNASSANQAVELESAIENGVKSIDMPSLINSFFGITTGPPDAYPRWHTTPNNSPRPTRPTRPPSSRESNRGSNGIYGQDTSFPGGENSAAGGKGADSIFGMPLNLNLIWNAITTSSPNGRKCFQASCCSPSMVCLALFCCDPYA